MKYKITITQTIKYADKIFAYFDDFEEAMQFMILALRHCTDSHALVETLNEDEEEREEN